MIRELETRPVERIPDLRHRPSWAGPWKLQRASEYNRQAHWWRIDHAGQIYRVEVEDGSVRRF